MKELEVRLICFQSSKFETSSDPKTPFLSCATSIQQEAKSLFLFHAELEEPASSHSHNDEQPSNPPDVSAYSTFLSSRPSSLEDSAISLILRCASQHPTLRTHIVHLSASSALPTLEQARLESKLPITVETCFHYLCLNSEQVEKGNTLFKCCPPIRNDENRENFGKVYWMEL